MKMKFICNSACGAGYTRGNTAPPSSVAADIVHSLSDLRETCHIDALLSAMHIILKHENCFNNYHSLEVLNAINIAIRAIHKAYIDAGYSGNVEDVMKIIYQFVKVADGSVSAAEKPSEYAAPSDLFDRIVHSNHDLVVAGIHDIIFAKKHLGTPPKEGPTYASSFPIVNHTLEIYHRPGPVSYLDESGATRTAAHCAIAVDFMTEKGGLGIFQPSSYYAADAVNNVGVSRTGNMVNCSAGHGYHLTSFYINRLFATEYSAQFTVSQMNCDALAVVVNNGNYYEIVAVLDKNSITNTHEDYIVDMLHGAAGKNTYFVRNTQEVIGYDMGIAFVDSKCNLIFESDTTHRFQLDEFMFTTSSYLAAYPAQTNADAFTPPSIMSIYLNEFLNSHTGTLHIVRTSMSRIIHEAEAITLFRLDGDLTRITFYLSGNTGSVDYIYPGGKIENFFTVQDDNTEELHIVFSYKSPHVNLYINGKRVYSTTLPDLQFTNPIAYFPERFKGFLISVCAYQFAMPEENALYLSA